MNNNSIHGKIYFMIVSFFVLLLLGFVSSSLFGFQINNISLLIGIIAFLSIVLCPLTMTFYKECKKLFQDKNYLLGIVSIVIVLCVVVFLLLIIIFFSGISFSKKYKVDHIEVVESGWNSVKVDYTKYNHDESSLKTIKKPFFIKNKPGDIISVGYPTGNPEKMIYMVDNITGLNIVAISMYIFVILTMIVYVVFTIWVIQKIRERRNIKK